MLYLTYWVRYRYENLFLTHTNVRKTLIAEQPIDEKKFCEDCFKEYKGRAIPIKDIDTYYNNII